MRGALKLVVASCLLVLIARGWTMAAPTGELRDYGSFVASGRAAAQGADPYGIHPLTFHVVLPRFEIWNPNLNPPVSILLFQGFDRVDPRQGFRIWWWFSLGCYVTAVGLLGYRYGIRRNWLALLWALALAGFWDTLTLGQLYLPLVLLMVVGWMLLENGRMVAAGAIMGCVIAIKPNFGVWVVLLFLARHYRAALTAAITVIGLWLVPLIAYGWTVYEQWVRLIVSDQGRAAFLTNASLPGLIARLGFAPLGVILSGLILVALGAWALRRQPAAVEVAAVSLLGGIIASPIAWVHYTLFLLPVFFSRPLKPSLLVAAALLVVPVPYVLGYLDAPLWQQATAGSVYAWAVLICGVGLTNYDRAANAGTERDGDTRVLRRRLRAV